MTVVPDGADTLLLIPHEGHHEGGGWMRYAAGLFILAWLGGWTAGFASAFSALASGKATAFLVFWLIAWTAGGAMAVSWVYRIFRPSVSESLRLQGGGIAYDSGIAPFWFNYGYHGDAQSRRDAWRSMFPKRARLELDRHTLQSLRLRETDGGNRLTVDAGAQRLDLAGAATEVEREWLYRLLAKRYDLSVPAGPGRG
jgi:hypothetical protein